MSCKIPDFQIYFQITLKFGRFKLGLPDPFLSIICYFWAKNSPSSISGRVYSEMIPAYRLEPE
jgi:hypothetical protein